MKNSILIAALFCMASCTKKAPHAQQKAPSLVKVYEICPQSIPDEISTFGIAKALQEVTITAQAAGKLEAKHFKDGSTVKKGDPLFQIDPASYQAQLDQAQGAYDQSIVASELAQRTFARFSELAPNEYVSALEFDQYQFDLLAKQAAVKTNQGKLNQAKINLGYCSIAAPITGITGNTSMDVGNFINQIGQPLVTIQKIDPIVIEFNVTTSQLQKILQQHPQGNLPCIIHTDDTCLKGELVFINNQIDSSTATTLLKAHIPNNQHRVYPGQFVDITVEVQVLKEAIAIPTEAIMTGQKGSFVFVVKNNKAHMQPVEIHTTYQDLSVIKSGLQQGDQVITHGQVNIAEGSPVRIQTRKEH